PRPVTCFALHVCELGRRVQRLKSAFLIGDDVTSDALVVELFALALERGHGVCVPALCPDVARFGVTSRTRLRPDVRRVPRAKQVWLCRSRFGALALLVCKVGVRAVDRLEGLWVIRDVCVELNVTVDLVVDRPVAFNVNSKLAQILRLDKRVDDRRAV